MAQNLIMDVACLEEEEFTYERDLRSHYDLPDHSALLSPLGILSRWLEKDRNNGIDPSTLPHKIVTENVTAEYSKSLGKIGEIHTAVMSKFLAAAQLNEIETAEALKLASRCVHWEFRISRFETSEFTEEQKTAHIEIKQKLSVAKVLLSVALQNHFSNRQQHDSQTTNGSGISNAGNSAHTSADPPPNGPQVHNSTVIGPTPTEFNASHVTQTDSPYDAAADVQRRQETEAARRLSEYEINKGRIDDLHEDIHNEYCRAVSPRRPAEATTLMNRLNSLEAVLRGILNLTTDPMLKSAIERDMTLLVVDSYILQANIMVAAQQQISSRTSVPGVSTPVQRPNVALTVGQAHSTMRPSPYLPSVQYFNRELDGMTFNVSHPFNVQDPQMTRGVDAAVREARNATTAPHVTFGQNPATIIPPQHPSQHTTVSNASGVHSSLPQQSPQQQRQEQTPNSQSSRPSPNHWHPMVNSQPVNQPYVSQPPQVGMTAPTGGEQYNLSTGSSQRNVQSRSYHPAISPHRYPEYAAEIRDQNASQLTVDAQIGQLPSMNACQGQQYLARVLGHRRYEGKVTDQSKTISLDEFMGHARSYQRSTGTTDAVVLTQLATFFSNQAFKWWQTNSTTVATLDELESRLRSRFEHKATTGLSVLREFCSRKQERGEDLLDYIDEMRRLAAACYPPLSVPDILTCIIDNATEKYRNLLAAKTYDSIAALTMFAEYIVRPEQAPEIKTYPSTQKKANYHNNYQQKSVYAVETGTESTENAIETTEEKSDVENSVTTAVVDAIVREMTRWNLSRAGQSQANQSAAQPQVQTGQNIKPNRIGVTCYGCQAPGVYRNECPKCNPTKNGPATL